MEAQDLSPAGYEVAKAYPLDPSHDAPGRPGVRRVHGGHFPPRGALRESARASPTRYEGPSAAPTAEGPVLYFLGRNPVRKALVLVALLLLALANSCGRKGDPYPRRSLHSPGQPTSPQTPAHD